MPIFDMKWTIFNYFFFRFSDFLSFVFDFFHELVVNFYLTLSGKESNRRAGENIY